MLHFLRVTGFLPLTYKVSLFVLSTNSHYAPTMAVLDAVDPVVNQTDKIIALIEHIFWWGRQMINK